MKILTVVGARPQFVKAAVLSQEIRLRPDCHEVVVHTGQHYDFEMSQIFFEQLGMRKPDHQLNVGSASQSVQTAEIMMRLEPIVQAEQPDWLVVYGDTNSTLAGALVGAKLRVPVAHVEAGLRSFNRTMPEEINRIVADHVADLHLVPSALAAAQLKREGISERVEIVGDLMVDLAKKTAAGLAARPPIMHRFALRDGQYAVATVHRAGNTDDPDQFASIIAGLRQTGLPIIFPVHPRTAALAERLRVGAGGDNITPCEPLSYIDMIALMLHARVVLTDSGGMQKEAFVLGVPCVTLREETEWTETLEGGWNALAGTDRARIAQLAAHIRPSTPRGDYYGDGQSARSIVDCLLQYAGLTQAPELSMT